MNRTELKIKWKVIGATIIVVVVVLAGINFYNMPVNQLNRQLELGQKYLLELNYEQAVAEFDKAIQMNSVSTDAYLGKAEAYENMSDYNKVLEVLEMGYWATSENNVIKEQLIEDYAIVGQIKTQEGAYEDSLEIFDRLLELNYEKGLVKLVECLNRYIDVLLREKRYDEIIVLANKYAKIVTDIDFEAILEKVELRKRLILQSEEIVFPFEPTDFKIIGYDLFKDYYEEVCNAFGYSDENKANYVENEYGHIMASTFEKDLTIFYPNTSSDFYWQITYRTSDGGSSRGALFVYPHGDESLVVDFPEWLEGFNLFVYPFDYNQWCQIMQVDLIKERGNKRVWSNGGESWQFRTKWGDGEYFEVGSDDGSLLIGDFSIGVIYKEDGSFGGYSVQKCV